MFDPYEVRLDETTDAGEFLLQNLYRGVNNTDRYKAAQDAIGSPEPKPADLAAVLDGKELSETLNALGQYGMEFESMTDNGDLSRDDGELAERGVASAEAFVRAAITIRWEKDNKAALKEA